jgi:hypothetical protein
MANGVGEADEVAEAFARFVERIACVVVVKEVYRFKEREYGYHTDVGELARQDGERGFVL